MHESIAGGGIIPTVWLFKFMNVIFQKYHVIETTFTCQGKLRRSDHRAHKQSYNILNFSNPLQSLMQAED